MSPNSQEKKKEYNVKWWLSRLAILVFTAGIIIWVLPRESKFNYIFEKDKPWKYGLLTAEFDFPIYKDDAEVKKERDSIMSMYMPYYAIDDSICEAMVASFERAYATGLNKVVGEKVKNDIVRELRTVYGNGIISPLEMNKLMADSISRVYIVDGNSARVKQVRSFYSEKMAYELLVRSCRISPDAVQKCSLNEYIKANVVLDSKLSETAKSDLLANVSGAKGIVQTGQKIIDRGEIVNENTYNILQSLQKESIKRHDTKSRLTNVLIGQIVLVSFIILCFMIFLDMYRKDYYARKANILLLFSSLIFYAVLTSFVAKTYNPGYMYVIPYAILPVIIRVFQDSRTAVMANVTNIMICSIAAGSPMEFFIIQFLAGCMAIFSLRELSQRSQLFNTAFLVLVTYILCAIGLDLLVGGEITSISLFRYKYLMISCVFLLLAYPLLFVFEKIFGFTSNVTLVELSNINNKLLRELSETTPGTFQHSMQVANLAAAAANRIRANSQLVRTGALYHDIGKMKNPTFFTENQNGVNPHSALDYMQSAQVVISHVTDGIKIAEKNNLPEVIKDFIRTHHGKGKTKYFYISYKNEHPDEQFDESVFTYPGPNPFSKETAILMMADSVEAASRSLKEYTDENIAKLVDGIIDTQVQEGFFNECPITFLDIENVKNVFKEKLKTMYHTRISYPKLKTGSEPEEKQDGQQKNIVNIANKNLFKRRRNV